MLPRLVFGLMLAVASGAAAGATSMKASAPDKMMPSGGGEAMRACEKLAAAQHVKMEERARFVKECVAKTMK